MSAYKEIKIIFRDIICLKVEILITTFKKTGFIKEYLQCQPLFCEWIKKNIEDWQSYVIVAPDEGSTKRGTLIANDLNLGTIHKLR